MSDILDLGQQVTKLISDSNASATSLYNMANGLRKTMEVVQRLMQGTSQHDYQSIINQLGAAQNRLANAAAILATASHSGKGWLDRHVDGNINPLSAEHRDDYGSSEMQVTSINETPLGALGEYMTSHNYGDEDYAVYSQDPVWRVLHRAAFPERFARPDPSSSSNGYATMVDSLEHAGVGYQMFQFSGRERTSEEIISRLGGGDNTEGSCSSLAFAYAGNVGGYDILDFRDGQSRSFFSQNSTIEVIANLPNVDSVILRGKDDILCTNNLLHTMVPGKEYYLATGVHAAIVRRLDDHFEYLELQHPTANGWKYLDDFVLLNRFRCTHSNFFECPNYLIDVASLSGNDEFLGILGYLNTSESEQRKGGNGHAR